jgi:hypothetical protein
MRAFPTPDALAQSFVKSYYTTAIYNLSNLFKYYARDAAIGRGGKISRDPISVKSTRLLSLNTPPDSEVIIVRITAVSLDEQVQVGVSGFAIKADGRHGFMQNFVLREIHGKLWIALDVLSFFDDAFWDQSSPDDFFTATDTRLLHERSTQGARSARRPPPDRDPPPADADEEPRQQAKAAPLRSERGKRRGKQDRRKGRDKFEWGSHDY